MKNVRKAERRKAERLARVDGDEMREAFTALAPAPVEISQTQEKRIDREQRAVQERAERRLEKLDSIWGVGLGPIKARLKWMTQLFGG